MYRVDKNDHLVNRIAVPSIYARFEYGTRIGDFNMDSDDKYCESDKMSVKTFY